MNILLACDYMGLNPGNFIPSIRELDKYTRKCDRENKVIYAFPAKCASFAWCKQMLAEGAILYFYQSKSLLYGIRFLNDIINKEKITVVHTHFEPFDKPTLFIKLMHPKIKIIWHLHDDFSLGKIQKPTLLQRMKAFAMNHLVTTIAVSPHIKTKYGYVLINHLAPTYLPSGTRYDAERDILREKIGVEQGEIAILFFGWDMLRKGLDIACEMLTYLPANLRKYCKLCIQVPRTEKSERFVHEHCNYPEQIRWLKSTPAVYDYHMAADIMLSAARSETFAYTIMEALAVGTPVVSSDIPGVQWSKDYHNIWYFESENAKACAEAVEKCLSEFNKITAIEAAQSIREKLPIENWCKEIYSIYIK